MSWVDEQWGRGSADITPERIARLLRAVVDISNRNPGVSRSSADNTHRPIRLKVILVIEGSPAIDVDYVIKLWSGGENHCVQGKVMNKQSEMSGKIILYPSIGGERAPPIKDRLRIRQAAVTQSSSQT